MVSENPEANLHLSPSFFVEYIHANKKQMDLCGDSGTDKRKEKLRTRRGPWSEEEDSTLVDYINNHGEGRWDSLARTAGLRRTGKSCRFRWLNYLRPGIQRGNFTLQEQLTIIELHFLWGNRWSKIAQSLPGRTDNEVKNYWRTRVGKQAKRLKCETNSKQFKETMRSVWMPRLVEQIGAATSGSSTTTMSTIEPSTDDVVVVVDSCSDASITSHVDDDLAASETLGAISSTPSWDDKVVQDFIEDTTTSSLHESQPLDHLDAHYGCSFYPGDDVLVFDNLWNWNDDGIFAPPSMNNFVLNY